MPRWRSRWSPGRASGTKRERDDGAVVEPADARAVRLPGLVERTRSSRCTSGHLDLDALEDDARRARRRATSASSVASTSAPSATVPREASSKCSRKCSGVKCESAPRRTSTRVTRLAPSVARDRFDLAHEILHQRALVHQPPPRATRHEPARPPPRPPGVSPRRRRSAAPSIAEDDDARGQPARARARARSPRRRRTRGSTSGTTRAGTARRSRRSGAPCPGGAPDATASTSTAASAPSHASISAARLLVARRTSTPPARAAALGDREPDAVVAAQRVADADHDACAHRARPRRSRKCVAQEMHGS